MSRPDTKAPDQLKAERDARIQRVLTQHDLNAPDPYKVLGLGRDATGEEIDEAQKVLRANYHPDRNPANLPASKKVGEAYEQITRERQKPLLRFIAGINLITSLAGIPSNDVVSQQFSDKSHKFDALRALSERRTTILTQMINESKTEEVVNNIHEIISILLGREELSTDQSEALLKLIQEQKLKIKSELDRQANASKTQKTLDETQPTPELTQTEQAELFHKTEKAISIARFTSQVPSEVTIHSLRVSETDKNRLRQLAQQKRFELYQTTIATVTYEALLPYPDTIRSLVLDRELQETHAQALVTAIQAKVRDFTTQQIRNAQYEQTLPTYDELQLKVTDNRLAQQDLEPLVVQMQERRFRFLSNSISTQTYIGAITSPDSLQIHLDTKNITSDQYSTLIEESQNRRFTILKSAISRQNALELPSNSRILELLSFKMLTTDQSSELLRLISERKSELTRK